MNQRPRTVFFVSDGTGITAEMLGHSLLTQFEGISFTHVKLPFVDSVPKADSCVARINQVRDAGAGRPIVFATLIDAQVRETICRADALVLDFFEMFLGPLEAELGSHSTHTIGRSHGAMDKKEYRHRIEAVNFALAHDDGVSSSELPKADVILIGVSRSGKTPTCLYLALQFGVKAANHPLIPEDFDRMRLPRVLEQHRDKLFGLTIAPERLAEIRFERRPDSRYASLDNCRAEVQQAETLMRREGVQSANSTSKSIEEIATTVLQAFKLESRVY